MKKAIVTFICYHTYEIEISDEVFDNEDCDTTIEIAEKDFESDMRYPIANTHYDDVAVKFL